MGDAADDVQDAPAGDAHDAGPGERSGSGGAAASSDVRKLEKEERIDEFKTPPLSGNQEVNCESASDSSVWTQDQLGWHAKVLLERVVVPSRDEVYYFEQKGMNVLEPKTRGTEVQAGDASMKSCMLGFYCPSPIVLCKPHNCCGTQQVLEVS